MSPHCCNLSECKMNSKMMPLFKKKKSCPFRGTRQKQKTERHPVTTFIFLSFLIPHSEPKRAINDFFFWLFRLKNVVSVSPGCSIWLVLIWENEVQYRNDGKAQNYMSEAVTVDSGCFAEVETRLHLCALTKFINSSAVAFSKYFDETWNWETMSMFNLLNYQGSVSHCRVKVTKTWVGWLALMTKSSRFWL